MMDGRTRSAAGPGFSQSRVCKRVWRLQLGGHLGSMSSTAKTKPPCWRRLWVEMSARRVGVLERLSFRVVRRPGSLVTSAAGSNKRVHRTTKRAPTGTHRTLTRKGARWECAQKVGSRKSREKRTKFEQRW